MKECHRPPGRASTAVAERGGGVHADAAVCEKADWFVVPRKTVRGLPVYLWRYLALKDPSVPVLAGGPNRTVANPAFSYPALMATRSKLATTTPGERTTFRINGSNVFPDRPSRAFGYPPNADPPSPPNDPLRQTVVNTLRNVSTIYTMRDVDNQIDGTTTPPAWHGDIPTTPVHGKVRNWMFLDWHVASTTRTNFF